MTKEHKMKKLVIIIMALVAMQVTAQEHRKEHEKEAKKERIHKQMNFTPEEIATLQTKKMVLRLDLTEAQQREIHKINLTNAKERKAKMEAHKKGVLHRAFSVFILNTKNEILLQRRALNKYHSGGLWTNTCCSHPRKGETTLQAANRRLNDEMGMKCELKEIFNFVYKATLDSNLIEHEYDIVFIGFSEIKPKINLNEVSEYSYISVLDLDKDLINNPNKYTSWLKICFNNFNMHTNLI